MQHSIFLAERDRKEMRQYGVEVSVKPPEIHINFQGTTESNLGDFNRPSPAKTHCVMLRKKFSREQCCHNTGKEMGLYGPDYTVDGRSMDNYLTHFYN